MTNKELQQLVEHISITCFKQPFQHQAFFNSRLQTTGGRYHLQTHHIDINHKVLDCFGLDELVGVIKHELCHYHLHLNGLGYQHKDADFKKLLKQVGGLRYVRSIKEQQGKEKMMWHYQCVGCGHTWVSHKRMRLKNKVCGLCRSSIMVSKQNME